MAKPKKAGRVKVIHTGPRVRKFKKKEKELEKQLASLKPCERKKHLTAPYYQTSKLETNQASSYNLPRTRDTIKDDTW